MIRFIIFILLAFIIYSIAKFFFRTLLGSPKTYDRMNRKKQKSKYEDVEDAKFREIDGTDEKKEKS